MPVLAAVDGTVETDSVVETGFDLASAYETELHVLHCVTQSEFEERKATVERVGSFQGYSKSQRADAAANVANEVVVGTLDNVDFEGISTMGRVGDPVSEITTVADEIDARYLVIGGRERSPAGKAVFGSTTQSVLFEADCPVVTVIDDR